MKFVISDYLVAISAEQKKRSTEETVTKRDEVNPHKMNRKEFLSALNKTEISTENVDKIKQIYGCTPSVELKKILSFNSKGIFLMRVHSVVCCHWTKSLMQPESCM